MNFPASHLTITIHCSPQVVYDFASNPANLPLWAQGLSHAVIVEKEDFWETDSPMGKVKIKFAPKNDFGVMDHDVILPNGEVNHNPFRVVKNGDASEVIFTLYRLPSMTDEDFLKDSQQIVADLKKLRSFLEK